MRDLRADARPLVDPPRPLHEQRLGRRADRRLDRRLAGRAFLEAEVPLGPGQQLEDRLLDLRLELAVQLAPGDGPEADQDVAQPARIAGALHRARAVELLGGDLARSHQPGADRLRVAAERGGDHAAALEADVAGGLPQLGGDAQHPALPAQVEQLEDVLDVEILEGALERHRSPRRGCEDVLEIARRAGAAPGLRGVRSGGIELHDPLPRLHRLIEPALPRQRGAGW